jgi:hypothetical protein
VRGWSISAGWVCADSSDGARNDCAAPEELLPQGERRQALWRIEDVLARKVSAGPDIDGFPEGGVLYLVSWAGWGKEHSSWEPEEEIPGGMVDDYMNRLAMDAWNLATAPSFEPARARDLQRRRDDAKRRQAPLRGSATSANTQPFKQQRLGNHKCFKWFKQSNVQGAWRFAD